MPIQVNRDGTWVAEYFGPYTGLNVQEPPSLIPDTASPAMSNFMLRNSEIRSVPVFTQFFVTPFALTGGGSAPFVLGIDSFIDINGIYHTVIWGNNTIAQVNSTATGFDAPIVAAPSSMGSYPVSSRAFANSIYYTAISQTVGRPNSGGGGSPVVITPFLGFWDGLAAAPVFTQTFSDASTSNSYAGISKANSPTVGGGLPGGPTCVGPLAIGGQFLGELNNQLILANVNVLDQGIGGAGLLNFPNMIWWCANGLPGQWDPTVNTSAGFNPFLDVSDLITGLMTIGVAGYIFRTEGVTQMTPTGQAITPWEFDHMWASDHGIGNVFPWSISQYGPMGCFIAEDDIYLLGVANVNKIGGKARDAIFADIANRVGSTKLVQNQPFAAILPKYKDGYVYLTYNILIPFSGFIRMYVYSFEDKNWAPQDFPIPNGGPFPAMTCAPNVV